MSRWNNETIERCNHCGKSYVTGCVKGSFICGDCKEAGHTERWMTKCEKCDTFKETNKNHA